MIEIKNIYHKYTSKSGEAVCALKNVSYVFNDCGMYFITGKSGSGKSTLLNLLGGLDKIQGGDIVVDGESLRGQTDAGFDGYRNTYAGLVFQEVNLIDGFSVYDNIDLPLQLQGNNNNSEKIAACLERVGLSGYEKRYPSELSGGQKQRIAIARQLAKGSRLILADEPTGNLDSENGSIILDILKRLSDERLVIVVSHDLEAAKKYGDEIIALADGQIIDNGEIQPLKTVSGLNGEGIIKKKGKFPGLYASKIASRNIRRKPLRFSVAVILSVAALALFAVFRTLTVYSPEKAMANTLINKEESFATLFQAYRIDDKLLNKNIGSSRIMRPKAINIIDENDMLNPIKLLKQSQGFK